MSLESRDKFCFQPPTLMCDWEFYNIQSNLFHFTPLSGQHYFTQDEKTRLAGIIALFRTYREIECSCEGREPLGSRIPGQRTPAEKNGKGQRCVTGDEAEGAQTPGAAGTECDFVSGGLFWERSPSTAGVRVASVVAG